MQQGLGVRWVGRGGGTWALRWVWWGQRWGDGDAEPPVNAGDPGLAAAHAGWRLEEDRSLTSVFGRCVSEGPGMMCSWMKQSPAMVSSRRTPHSTARRTQGKPARRSQQAEAWQDLSRYPSQPALCQRFPSPRNRLGCSSRRCRARPRGMVREHLPKKGPHRVLPGHQP